MIPALLALALLAQAPECPGGRLFPATAQPECVTETGARTACGPGSIRLWPEHIRPADPAPPATLPRERDTTSRLGATTSACIHNNGAAFASVAVAGKWLFVAHSSGLSAWTLRQPGKPGRAAVADGCLGQWLQFPPLDEIQNFVEDVAAVERPDGTVLAATAARPPVGFAVWHFRPSGGLRQLYQAPGLSSVRQVAFSGGAVIAGGDDGIRVYSVDALVGLGAPCLDPARLQDAPPPCPGVLLGRAVAYSRRYVAAKELPGGSILIASGSGQRTPLELHRIRLRPWSVERIHRSRTGAAGVAWFTLGGQLYLAVGLQGSPNRLQILAVDVDAASVRVQTAADVVTDGSGGNLYVDASVLGTRSAEWPVVYEATATSNPSGPDVESLRRVERVGTGAAVSLTRIDVGGSYRDCSRPDGPRLTYWSHGYGGNPWGFNNTSPRRMVCTAAGYCYRAGATTLTVNRATELPLPPEIFADGFESGDAGRWSE